MADLKQTVALTNVNMETLSRQKLLDWVNSKVNGNYGKIEELCSGVAYCQMMEQLFPKCIGIKKLKIPAKLEHEQMHNLRLLQMAFTSLRYDKVVPIASLLKGRFQDNFEFLQWFKKFYDASSFSSATENIENMPSPLKKSKTFLKSNSTEKQHCTSSPATVILQHNIQEIKKQMEDIKADRDFYLKRLKAVETILKLEMERSKNEEFCKRAFNILYATQNEDEEF